MEKHKINSIIFVLDGYPYQGSSACVFVRNLIVALVDQDIHCTVICPQIITPSTIKKRKIPYFFIDHTESGKEIPVYAPRYVYYPANLRLTQLSMNHHMNAVLKTIKREKLNADVIYGHFIFQCGLTAVRVGKKLNIPSFLGAGESDKLVPGNQRNHGVYETGVKNLNWQKHLNQLSGIICVSEWTKDLMIENRFITEDFTKKMIVCPNAVNQNVFHQGDQRRARKELNLPNNDFIALFVGAFNDNKGVLRVSEAVENVPEVKAVFLGKGVLQPQCSGMLYSDTCDNKTVAKYMQAADCFVLPTKSEGCCNAILEALSCGLPVISSDLPFNDGILDDNNSIRVNPNRVDEIRNALSQLVHDERLRVQLTAGAIASSKAFDINLRAQRIINFMSEVITEC